MPRNKRPAFGAPRRISTMDFGLDARRRAFAERADHPVGERSDWAIALMSRFSKTRFWRSFLL
jgi:hypothetical protein